MKKHATAHWQGTGKEGKGHISTQSAVLSKTPYNYAMRFEDAAGTNPEELIAAAHAGCFTMKLSFNLTNAGFPPDSLDTKCEISMDPAKGQVTTSDLTVTAKVAGIGAEKFQELVNHAKENCPISKLLNCDINCTATLS